MPSFIDFRTRDIKNRPGRLRIPITAQTLPTAVGTYISGFITAAQGSALPMINGIVGVNLVINAGVTPSVPAADGDSRMVWQATMQDTLANNFRWSIPGRNPLPALYASSAQDLANLDGTEWTALLTALINTAGTVHMVNPENDSVLLDYTPVKATTRGKKLPREGNVRG